MKRGGKWRRARLILLASFWSSHGDSRRSPHRDSLRSQKKSANATFDARRVAFEAVYRATTYQAVWPPEAAQDHRVGAAQRYLDLRVDQHCPDLDAWLNSVGEACWSYLTAANPASRQLDDEANAARQAALMARVVALGRPFLRGQSLADDARWPPEPSLLVGGMEQREAAALATQFGQNAFLFGLRGQAATLCWTPTAP